MLLINALIDTASNIHIYGEVGLAALYALGFKVGRVERSASNEKDYESVKQFFLAIFEKAAMNKVKIFLPVDFIVSQKVELEEEKKANENSQNNT